jgi:hypothetical protein
MLEQVSHATHMCGTYALVLPNLKVQLPLQDHHAKLDIKIEMETIWCPWDTSSRTQKNVERNLIEKE